MLIWHQWVFFIAFNLRCDNDWSSTSKQVTNTYGQKKYRYNHIIISFAHANIIKPNALFNFSITEFGERSAIC